MLFIEQLSVTRGQGDTKFTVSLPNLSLKQGEILALKGPSGCGKSTILELIGLILKPTTVQRYCLGNKLQEIQSLLLQANHYKLALLRANYFGFMPQTGGLLPFLTVQENIELSSNILGKNLDSSWIANLVNKLNIQHLLNKYPKALSIGERQRVSFIRAIAHKPSILLADEPTASLDPENAHLLFELMLDLVQKEGIATLVVSHDWQSLQNYHIPFLSVSDKLKDPKSSIFVLENE